MSNEKVIKKIQALLSKTTENGASEHEAISAIKKAKELMKTHYLTTGDVMANKADDIIMVNVSGKFKGVNADAYFYYIGELFDTKFFKNGREYSIYGYKTDVDLVKWFYDFINESIDRAVSEFLKTETFKNKYASGVSKKTLTNTFVKGYVQGVATKLKVMLDEQVKYQMQNTTERGLIVSKMSVVTSDLYKKHGILLRNSSSNVRLSDKETYNGGKQAGSQLNLNKPVSNAQNYRGQKLLN